MTDSSPESSGTAPAAASDAAPLTEADILVEQSSSDELLAGAVAEGMASAADPVGTLMMDTQETATLNLGDVLAGGDVSDPNLGASLKFETLGGNTVISVDADGGEGAAVPIVTLHGVTNVDLAQLLANNEIIT